MSDEIPRHADIDAEVVRRQRNILLSFVAEEDPPICKATVMGDMEGL